MKREKMQIDHGETKMSIRELKETIVTRPSFKEFTVFVKRWMKETILEEREEYKYPQCPWDPEEITGIIYNTKWIQDIEKENPYTKKADELLEKYADRYCTKSRMDDIYTWAHNLFYYGTFGSPPKFNLSTEWNKLGFDVDERKNGFIQISEKDILSSTPRRGKSLHLNLKDNTWFANTIDLDDKKVDSWSFNKNETSLLIKTLKEYNLL